MSQLPPGFVLDEAPARSQSAPAALPDGFVLDAQDAPVAPGAVPASQGLHWPSLSSVFNGVVNGATESMTKPSSGLTLSGLVKGAYDQGASAVTLPRDVLSGAVDLKSDEAIRRSVDFAGMASPITPASRMALTAPAAAAVATVPTGVARDAADLGVTLTAGQRTADPVLRSTEDAMLGGGKGTQAQRVAQQRNQEQAGQVFAARDAIGESAGQSQVTLDRPGDAGGIVGDRVSQVGGQAAADLEARNAAEVARAAQVNELAVQSAQAASDEMARRVNPTALQPVDAGASVAEGLRGRAAEGRQTYQQAYRDAFSREGQLEPGFFQGVARPGAGEMTVPGAAINEFAAPISRRITDDLVGRAEPIIVDRTLTPLASATLNDLDRVASLNLGRIGQPSPGYTVAGVNLRGVEQARKIIGARLRAANATPEDARALRGIMDAFDTQLERGFDSTLFSGDEAALQGLRAARSQFRDFQQTFRPRGQGDDAGRVIQSIIERDASPEEVANHVLGASRVGATGTSVRTYRRLNEIFGPDAPEMADIRGAAWAKITGGLDPSTPRGAQQISERIREFTTGQGSTLAREMFSAEALGRLRSFGNAMQSFARRTPAEAQTFEAEGPIRTLIDIANRRLSPEDTASALFGYGNKVSTANIRFVDAVGDVVGRNSPEWSAIRQGLWQRVTGVSDGRTEMGAQKMSERILEFLNGDGRTLARRLFSDEERTQMLKLANVQKAIAARPGTTNPSNSGNRLAGLAREGLASVASMIGASATGPIGAAFGYAAGKGIGAISNARNARQAAALFSGGVPVSIGSRLAEKLSGAATGVARVAPPRSALPLAREGIPALNLKLNALRGLQGPIPARPENEQR